MKNIVLFYIIVSSLLACNKTLSQNKKNTEEKVFCFVLNNLDSIHIPNFSFFASHNKATIYYHYWLDVDTNKVTEWINRDPWSTRYNIFDSVQSGKTGEFINYITDTTTCNKYKLIKVTAYETYKKKAKEGDMHMLILKSWKYKNHDYVLIVIDGKGTIMQSEILVKLNSKGNIQRVVTSQGEK